jgi:hypothetical protein
VVVVSGPLDSRDLAEGATDDGIGVATLLGAEEAILHSGQKPRHTLLRASNGRGAGIFGGAEGLEK